MWFLGANKETNNESKKEGLEHLVFIMPQCTRLTGSFQDSVGRSHLTCALASAACVGVPGFNTMKAVYTA